MNNTFTIIAILGIFFSYTGIEILANRFHRNREYKQLWTDYTYLTWGLVLFIAHLAIRPYDYIFEVPINNTYGVIMVVVIATITIWVCLTKKDVYYPSSDNKVKFLNYSIILPLFEEIAFRGLILPLTLVLLGDITNPNLVILLNASLFTLFHRNYWSMSREHKSLYFGFFGLGVAFTMLAYTNQSIVYSLICHIIVNGGNAIYRNIMVKKQEYKKYKTTTAHNFELTPLAGCHAFCENGACQVFCVNYFQYLRC